MTTNEDDERAVNLGPLDPERGPAWAARTRDVATRAAKAYAARLEAQDSMWGQVIAIARPAFALAAAVALVAWLPRMFGVGARPERSEHVEASAELLDLAGQAGAPSAQDAFELLESAR